MRSFDQTQGANVDTNQYPDSPPNVKLEDIAYKPVILLSARIVDTKYGERAIMELGMPYFTDEGEEATEIVQAWGTQRIVNQVRGMDNADYPCYVVVVEVPLGKWTSYELADPKRVPDAVTPVGNQNTLASPSQQDAPTVEVARGQDMPDDAREPAMRQPVNTMPQPKAQHTKPQPHQRLQ